jgi:U4/U6.U5 tri-snRNP-associated protein 2
MPPKGKRNLTARESGDDLDGSSPMKRLRVEDAAAPSTEEQNGVHLSPAEIELPEEEEPVEVGPEPVLDDLYLETVLPMHDMVTNFKVNRSMLEFDFEKVCSVTLTNLNVYGCLVCGKYFSGKYFTFE